MATKNLNAWPITEADDEMIISYYEQHPSLWKFADPKYKMTKERPIVLMNLVETLGKDIIYALLTSRFSTHESRSMRALEKRGSVNLTNVNIDDNVACTM